MSFNEIGTIQPQYAIESWIRFQELENIPLLFLDTWMKKDGKFGPEAQFIVAVPGKKEAKVLGSSVTNKLLVRKLAASAERGDLPLFGMFVREESNKSESGFFWNLIDATVTRAQVALIDKAVDAAKAQAAQDASSLPSELPF